MYADNGFTLALTILLEPLFNPDSILVGQRHFHRPYKHEAQASEQVTSKLTRSRVVLVFMAKKAQVALPN